MNPFKRISDLVWENHLLYLEHFCDIFPVWENPFASRQDFFSNHTVPFAHNQDV